MAELSKEEIERKIVLESENYFWTQKELRVTGTYDAVKDFKAGAFFVLKLLQEYADQEKKKEAIEFAKFIKNGGYHGELIVTEDLWFDEDNNEIGDTEQLYSLYTLFTI